MMPTLGSPFATSNIAQSLPDTKIGDGVLSIRLDGEDTDRVLISTNGRTASATNAQLFLKGTEAVDICGKSIRSAGDVSIIATVGTANIYWGVT